MNRWLKFSFCFLIITFFLVFTFCSGQREREDQANSSLTQSAPKGDSELENSQGDEVESSNTKLTRQEEEKWKESFYFVRDEIRFEPSTGIYKFDRGLLWSGQGNAQEQALFLANLLGDEGEEVRVARGNLNDEKASSLLESMFPERKDYGYGKDVLLSWPAQDKKLIQAVKDHWWVQIYKNEEWLDLDPSFPEAEIGKAYAPLEETFDSFDEDFFPTVTISLDVEKGIFKKRKILNPETETVLEWEGSVKEVINKPLTLKIVASFQAAEEEEESGGLGGLFGGLSGGEKKASNKSKKIEAIYHTHLIIDQEEVEGGSFSQKIPASPKQKVEETITKVALIFQFESPKRERTIIERPLFQKNKPKQRPNYVQRHSILITANDIPQEAWTKDLKKVLGKERLESLKKELEEIKTALKKKKNISELYEKSISLEDKAGPQAGHLLNMIFASTSDQISHSLAQALSVFSFYSQPRIIINTVEGTGDQLQVYLDLRQDSKQAISYPGQAARMSETFLYGRGVMDSILEGKVLELLTGKKSLTTARLMELAATKGIPINMFSKLEKKELTKLRLPPFVAPKAKKVIDSGHILIIPVKPVDYDGQKRWGWWDLNPLSGEVVGVLDSGLHQAMIERTILDTSGMLNDDMGLVVGAMVGCVDTYWVLFALVLKYGELNKAALEEAKAYMKEIGNYLCPEFEKKVEIGVGVSAEIEDCWKKEVGIGFKGGLKIEMGWCAKFAKGFKCASTTILNVYLSAAE